MNGKSLRMDKFDECVVKEVFPSISKAFAVLNGEIFSFDIRTMQMEEEKRERLISQKAETLKCTINRFIDEQANATKRFCEISDSKHTADDRGSQ